MNENLIIVCVHVLDGQPVYYETKTHDMLCEECFKRKNSYGHDENGFWRIPQKNLSYFKTVCVDCIEEIASSNKNIYN